LGSGVSPFCVNKTNAKTEASLAEIANREFKIWQTFHTVFPPRPITRCMERESPLSAFSVGRSDRPRVSTSAAFSARRLLGVCKCQAGGRAARRSLFHTHGASPLRVCTRRPYGRINWVFLLSFARPARPAPTNIQRQLFALGRGDGKSVGWGLVHLNVFLPRMVASPGGSSIQPYVPPPPPCQTPHFPGFSLSGPDAIKSRESSSPSFHGFFLSTRYSTQE